MTIPSGTPSTVLDTLEIVLCIDTTVSEGMECFIGVSEETILGTAREKIVGVLRGMCQSVDISIDFYTNWSEYQSILRSHAADGNRNGNLNMVEDGVFELVEPGRGMIYGRMQVLLPFFIEAATPINTADRKWTIYLTCKSSLNSSKSESDSTADNDDFVYNISGFLTSYSYFKFPEGFRVRISQVLVFPRHQNNRLGTRLYTAVSRKLRNDPDCGEICVEDPTDGFERIRAVADYKEGEILGIFGDGDGDLVDKMVKEMKLTREHAERLVNLNKSILQTRLSVPPSKKHKSSPTLPDPTTELRQQIKRWLLKKYRKEIPEERVERIERLAELYEVEMEEFIEPLIELLSSS